MMLLCYDVMMSWLCFPKCWVPYLSAGCRIWMLGAVFGCWVPYLGAGVEVGRGGAAGVGYGTVCTHGGFYPPAIDLLLAEK